jgi:ABC-type glycerol-3-phosphate transport system permease component
LSPAGLSGPGLFRPVLQVALTFISMAATYGCDLGVIFAGVVLAAVPMVIL